MADVTSRHIMKATGIGDIGTLTRWHQKGLIPPPEVLTHPGGRGKMAYWPEWVLHRCVRIVHLRKAGKKLDEIGELLGDDWEKEAGKFMRQYRFADVSQRIDRDNALMSLSERVHKLLGAWASTQQERLCCPKEPLIPIAALSEALALTEQGINVVLVLDGDGAHITADFMVSDHLARFSSMDHPLLVVPLSDEIRRCFRDQMILSPKPAVKPLRKVAVSESDADDEQERRFEALDGWSFEIEAPKRQEKRRKNAD